MLDKKSKNAEIFQHTEQLCKTNTILKNTIALANKKQYIVQDSDEVVTASDPVYSEPAKIVVSSKRTIEAASAYKDYRICVHNFASATKPGGGVVNGANAQEEAICRCSTLNFNISQNEMLNKFYNKHLQMLKTGKMNSAYNDDCIYTPEVIVFKSDTAAPELLPQNEWFNISVITCPAPNLRERPANSLKPGQTQLKLKDMELKNLHVKRISRICDIAKKEKAEVLILGAFGCGVFSNPPRIVAEAMAEIVKKYRYDFKVIEFAVYCPPSNMENYEVFKRRLKF